jgi:hypothetical protein
MNSQHDVMAAILPESPSLFDTQSNWDHGSLRHRAFRRDEERNQAAYKLRRLPASGALMNTLPMRCAAFLWWFKTHRTLTPNAAG